MAQLSESAGKSSVDSQCDMYVRPVSIHHSQVMHDVDHCSYIISGQAGTNTRP